MKTNRKNQKAKFETGIEQLIEVFGGVWKTVNSSVLQKHQ